MLSIAVYSNALSPIVCSVLEVPVAAVSSERRRLELPPLPSSLAVPMVTLASEVQLANALALMVLTEGGSATSATPVPIKAFKPMTWTFELGENITWKGWGRVGVDTNHT